MSLMTTTASKPIRAPAMPQPAGLLARWFAAWKRRRQIRRDEHWLQSQPDYLLRDIGISRGEIEGIVRLGRYR